MAVRKLQPKITPDMRAIQDRVDRARRAIPRRDYLGIDAWAREHGHDVHDVMDHMDDRATSLEYLGELPRDQAELRAKAQTIEFWEGRA